MKLVSLSCRPRLAGALDASSRSRSLMVTNCSAGDTRSRQASQTSPLNREDSGGERLAPRGYPLVTFLLLLIRGFPMPKKVCKRRKWAALVYAQLRRARQNPVALGVVLTALILSPVLMSSPLFSVFAHSQERMAAS